ncbi:hypothetical protein CO709_25980 [Burkholderia thailandensis]|nr:hypothetical protein CO709_25980 [Burkholderia thailandensis]
MRGDLRANEIFSFPKTAPYAARIAEEIAQCLLGLFTRDARTSQKSLCASIGGAGEKRVKSGRKIMGASTRAASAACVISQFLTKK